jgi:hypothetical protein
VAPAREDPECAEERPEAPAALPVEPPDPELSAKATGADTTAAPTPSKTASVPTLPMYRA